MEVPIRFVNSGRKGKKRKWRSIVIIGNTTLSKNIINRCVISYDERKTSNITITVDLGKETT